MALPDYSNYQYPNFNTGGNFPYQDFLHQLQASFWARPMNSYGRFSGTGVTTPQGYPAPGTTPNGPPGGYGSGGLLKSAPGPAPAPPMQGQPQSGGPAPSATQPGSGANDPGFGAAPSSASFANLSDADKAYLYRMQQQYRQDMRGQPGAHQLYFDLFGGQADPTQINSLINDTGYNDPLLKQSFNVNAYNGPMKALVEQLIAKNGGQNLAYGQQGAGSTYRASTSPYPRGTMIDFRTGKPAGLLGS